MSFDPTTHELIRVWMSGVIAAQLAPLQVYDYPRRVIGENDLVAAFGVAGTDNRGVAQIRAWTIQFVGAPIADTIKRGSVVEVRRDYTFLLRAFWSADDDAESEKAFATHLMTVVGAISEEMRPAIAGIPAGNVRRVFPAEVPIGAISLGRTGQRLVHTGDVMQAVRIAEAYE